MSCERDCPGALGYRAALCERTSRAALSFLALWHRIQYTSLLSNHKALEISQFFPQPEPLNPQAVFREFP